MHIDHVLRHLHNSLRSSAHLLLRLLLLGASLTQHTAKMIKLAAQSNVHALHKHLGNAVHALYLRLRCCKNKIIHRALHGQHGAQNALLHLHGHLLADVFHRLTDVGRLLLRKGQHSRFLRNRLGQRVKAEDLAKAVNRFFAFIGIMGIEQIEDDRGDNARNGREECRTHAADQLFHRSKQRRGIRSIEIQPRQTHHQAQECAQNAQRSQDTGCDLRKARTCAGIDDRFLIDILRYIAAFSVRISKLGILQKIRPDAFQSVAKEMNIIPGFLFLILLILRNNHARRTAKLSGKGNQRQQTARHSIKQHQHNGQINQRVQGENSPDQFHKFEHIHHVSLPFRVLSSHL